MYNVDIVCITETHISKDINDAELEIEGYSYYRGDRNFNLHSNNGNNVSDGGGSIIYFRNYINAEENKIFRSAPDSVAIDINTRFGKICIACIYRSTSLPENLNKTLIDCISVLCKESNEYETILMGDFNLPDVSWENSNVIGIVSSENKFLNLQLEYLDLFTEKGLHWSLTNEITRCRMVNGSLQESLLDQILFTNDALVSGFKILSPLGKSDHVCMKIDLGISFKNNVDSKKELIKKPVWSKISSEELLELSNENIDWNYSNVNLSIEEMWQELHGKLSSITSNVPTSVFDSNNRPVKPPWSIYFYIKAHAI